MKNIKILIGTIFILFLTCQVNAQRAYGDVGIGAQIGSPTGLSLQFYRGSGASLDLLAAWNLDDFFYLNAHALYQPTIGNSGNLHFIYGPGAFLGLINNANADDDVDLGLSVTGGLSLLISKFEIYGRVTPRIALLESTDVNIGGGLGMRVYF